MAGVPNQVWLECAMISPVRQKQRMGHNQKFEKETDTRPMYVFNDEELS